MPVITTTEPITTTFAEERFGKFWVRPAYQASPVGGICTDQRTVIAELTPNGPPCPRLITISPRWGGPSGYGGNNEGQLLAYITASVAKASHLYVCDLFSGSIVVPGGKLSIAMQQVGLMHRLLNRLDISVSDANGIALGATYSLTAELTAAAPGTEFPLVYRSFTGPLPERARSARLVSLRNTGSFNLAFLNYLNVAIAAFDSAVDDLFSSAGVSVPIGATQFVVTGPPSPVAPVVQFQLS